MLLDVFNTDEPADGLLHRLRRWQEQQHSHHCPPTAEHPTIDYSAAIMHLITTYHATSGDAKPRLAPEALAQTLTAASMDSASASAAVARLRVSSAASDHWRLAPATACRRSYLA